MIHDLYSMYIHMRYMRWGHMWIHMIWTSLLASLRHFPKAMSVHFWVFHLRSHRTHRCSKHVAVHQGPMLSCVACSWPVSCPAVLKGWIGKSGRDEICFAQVLRLCPGLGGFPWFSMYVILRMELVHRVWGLPVYRVAKSFDLRSSCPNGLCSCFFIGPLSPWLFLDFKY